MGKYAEAHRICHEAWNRRDFDARVSTLVENFTFEDHPGGRTLTSRDEFKSMIKEFADAVPDGQLADRHYIEAENASVAIFVVRGTNAGPFGPLPPTGHEIELPMCEVMRYDGDGMVISGELFFDLPSFMTQLGHPPAGEMPLQRAS
jgi:steroid delta-isomerase-like uncharacterized protein